jgi:hypothetical protein
MYAIAVAASWIAAQASVGPALSAMGASGLSPTASLAAVLVLALVCGVALGLAASALLLRLWERMP